MAQRYRVQTPQPGDIADPRDLMNNLSTLMGEFNGGLDADNIPETSVNSDMILHGSFVSITSQALTNSVSFNGETTEWRNINGASETINELDVNCNTDTLLEIEWSATWSRTGSGPADYHDAHAAAFRVLVDGSEVARMMRSPRSRHQDHTYLVGVAPVQGGKHRISVEIRQWTFSSDQAHEQTTVINERELVVRGYKR